MTIVREKTCPLILPAAIASLYDCIISSKPLLRKNSVLIFVCGALPNEKDPTNRDLFVQCMRKEMPAFRLFMAEDVIKELVEKLNYDLLTLERMLAQYSDCLLIIVESDGAIAELGAFAIDDDLCRLVLAVNDKSFENNHGKSFITDGPLAKICRESEFGFPIYSNLKNKSILVDLPRIKNQLKQAIGRGKSIPVLVSDWDDLKNKNGKYLLMLLYDIIHLFYPVQHSELIEILKKMYSVKDLKVNMELAALVAMKLITRISVDNRSFWVPALCYDNGPAGQFFDFRINVVSLRCLIIRHYQKFDYNRLKKLSEYTLEAKRWEN